jgi:hypothetical protein
MERGCRKGIANRHTQLGVIVGLVSTSVQSVGLTLQRKSHLLEEEKEDDYDRRPPYKRRRWQVRRLRPYICTPQD